MKKINFQNVEIKLEMVKSINSDYHNMPGDIHGMIREYAHESNKPKLYKQLYEEIDDLVFTPFKKSLVNLDCIKNKCIKILKNINNENIQKYKSNKKYLKNNLWNDYYDFNHFINTEEPHGFYRKIHQSVFAEDYECGIDINQVHKQILPIKLALHLYVENYSDDIKCDFSVTDENIYFEARNLYDLVDIYFGYLFIKIGYNPKFTPINYDFNKNIIQKLYNKGEDQRLYHYIYASANEYHYHKMSILNKCAEHYQGYTSYPKKIKKIN